MTFKPLEATYGRWTVVSRDGHRVACRCECGTVRSVDSSTLRDGTSKSCGCLMREQARERGRNTAKHRMALTSEYRIWVKMKNRCGPQASGKSRALYYERGIRVCSRWLASFENFYVDMGPRPSMQHTLDRRENDGPYAPENCRWATKAEQNRNTRRNRLLTVFGDTKPLVDWLADPRCKVGGDTLRTRIKRGYDVEWSITTPALDTTGNLWGRNPAKRISDRSDRETAERNDTRRLVRQAKRA